MHYYITKAESGHQACLEADHQGASNFDVGIIGAVSESGERHVNDGTVGDLTSIEDAEFYVRTLMYITKEYKKRRIRIGDIVQRWYHGGKIKSHEIEDVIKFFKDLSNRDYYTSVYLDREIVKFKRGLRFAASNFGTNGATNMYEVFGWHEGEMWVVFIENEV